MTENYMSPPSLHTRTHTHTLNGHCNASVCRQCVKLILPPPHFFFSLLPPPGEKRDHLSFPFSFFLSLFFFVFLHFSTPSSSSPSPEGRLPPPTTTTAPPPPRLDKSSPMMPSNAVTNAAAFKGSDYTDSPGSRMVRDLSRCCFFFFCWNCSLVQ